MALGQPQSDASISVPLDIPRKFQVMRGLSGVPCPSHSYRFPCVPQIVLAIGTLIFLDKSSGGLCWDTVAPVLSRVAYRNAVICVAAFKRLL